MFGGGVCGSGMMRSLRDMAEWSYIFSCIFFPWSVRYYTVLSFISVVIEGQAVAICECYMMPAAQVYQHPQREKQIWAIFHQPQICIKTWDTAYWHRDKHTHTTQAHQQPYCTVFSSPTGQSTKGNRKQGSLRKSHKESSFYVSLQDKDDVEIMKVKIKHLISLHEWI